MTLCDIIFETAELEKIVYNQLCKKSDDFIYFFNLYCVFELKLGYKLLSENPLIIEIYDDMTYLKFFKLLKYVYENGYKINKVEIETLLNKSKKLDWNIFCEYYCNEQNFNMLKNLKLSIV